MAEIFNSNSNTLLSGTSSEDYIGNRGSNVTIKGGDGDDYIYSWSNGTKIFGNAGNDTVTLYADKQTVDGGEGNDSISGQHYYHSINGGTGDDIINIQGSGCTIIGGKDNDIIINWGKNTLFKYTEGDGNDIIRGFNGNDTLSISGGSYSTTKSGDDVIVTVGEGKITLVGVAELSKLNIAGKKSSVTTAAATLLTVNDSTKSPVTVGSSVKIIDASKRTKAVKITGNALNNSIVGGASNDSMGGKDGNDKLFGENGDDKLWGDDGNDTLDGGAGNDSLKGGEGKDSLVGGSGNDTLWGGNGNDIMGGNVGNDKLFGEGGNDKLWGDDGNDTLTGGKGNDTLKGGNGSDVFLYKNGDGNDIITDYAEEDKISISGTAKVTTSGNDVVFTVGKGKITVKDAANKTFSYIANGKTETYSTISPSPDDGDPYTISKDGKGITLSSSYSDKTFESEDYGKLVTIDASAVTKGTDILGNDNANKIIGGKGNDTLEGLIGNDTLTGGKGADVFTYYDGDGKDVITDYAEEDKIYIASGKVNSISKKSNDVILNVKGDENGTITVKKALTKGITYIDEDNFEHDCIKGKETVLTKDKTVTITKNYWKNDVDIARYGDNLKTVDASAVTHSLTITGNDKANQIIGSKKNDTIIGGESDDTLYGDDGADIFVYRKGDGDDYIVDYKEEDKIQLINVDLSGNSQADDNDLIFKFVGSSGKIRVKDGAGKNISFIDADGKSISTEHITPNFLAEDDNFDMGNQLSSIVQSKAADYSFLSTSNNLAKKDNLIAFSGKK